MDVENCNFLLFYFCLLLDVLSINISKILSGTLDYCWTYLPPLNVELYKSVLFILLDLFELFLMNLLIAVN